MQWVGAGAVAFEVTKDVTFAVLTKVDELCAAVGVLMCVVMVSVLGLVDVGPDEDKDKDGDDPRRVESDVPSVMGVDAELRDWRDERAVDDDDDDTGEDELKLTVRISWSRTDAVASVNRLDHVGSRYWARLGGLTSLDVLGAREGCPERRAPQIEGPHSSTYA